MKSWNPSIHCKTKQSSKSVQGVMCYTSSKTYAVKPSCDNHGTAQKCTQSHFSHKTSAKLTSHPQDCPRLVRSEFWCISSVLPGSVLMKKAKQKNLRFWHPTTNKLHKTSAAHNNTTLAIEPFGYTTNISHCTSTASPIYATSLVKILPSTTFGMHNRT